jgi:signal transduction histidine kinase
MHIYRDFSRGPAHYEISLLLLTGIIVYASIVFRVTIGIILALLVTLAVVPQQLFKLHEIPFFRPISFGVAAILIAALVGIILNRRDQLKEANDIQQSLTRQVVTVRETEKQSLAHELHDVVLQKAVDIAHEIDEILEEVPEEASRARLKQLRTDVENMMDDTRQLLQDLRPPVLDEIGFVSSLEELAYAKAEHNAEVDLNILGQERRLPEMVETALFRIAEEALSNIKRHSRATRIEITVEFAPKNVRLQVADNGVGFALPTQRQLVGRKKFGIVDMSERARLLGGNLRIESLEGQGTSLVVEMPV